MYNMSICSGSVKGGPRCDEDDVFVDHSILGTIEEYANSRVEDRQVKRKMDSYLNHLSIYQPIYPFTNQSVH